MTEPEKGPPIPVKAVDFVMYCADKPEETRAWYQRMFGFGPGEEWNAYWSEFDTTPVSFCLNGPSENPGGECDWQGTPAIAFAVEDIHAVADTCEKEGIRILAGPVETSVCWTLFVADPEGNRLILHQRKDGSAG